MSPPSGITAVPGIRVGHWTDRRAATGCTVVLCPPGTVGGVDVRGAAPGTRETDLLRPGNLVEEVHAVLLAGGSAFGLDAATGVVRWLEEHGIGLAFGGHCVPIVPAAILFDLGTGRPRRPDAEAGYRATERAASRAGAREVPEGSVGAGAGATVAKSAGPRRLLKGGIGTAHEELENGAVVAALVAVNAVGSIVDPSTAAVVAAPRADEGGFMDVEALVRSARRWQEPADQPDDGPPDAETAAEGDVSAEPGANTTLAVVATNAVLTKAQTNRLATVAHDGFARAIWPVHTRSDGDTVFALATGHIEVEGAALTSIEAMAVRAVERAIVRGVQQATGLAGVPSAAEWLEAHPPPSRARSRGRLRGRTRGREPADHAR